MSWQHAPRQRSFLLTLITSRPNAPAKSCRHRATSPPRSASYPELKASENFSELQAQLEGTENRIAESRRLYNESVQTFNTAVRRFPANIVAGIFGFEKKSKFEAQESAANAPQVEF